MALFAGMALFAAAPPCLARRLPRFVWLNTPSTHRMCLHWWVLWWS